MMLGKGGVVGFVELSLGRLAAGSMARWKSLASRRGAHP
jgi:hypothetical protein